MSGRISIDPASVDHGAARAGALARALAESVARIGGLPNPEGTPPEVQGQLHAIAASLAGPERALQTQVVWLRLRAAAARHADSPLGALLLALCPDLPSPEEVPNPFAGVRGHG